MAGKSSIHARCTAMIAMAVSVFLVFSIIPGLAQESSFSGPNLYERIFGLELIQLATKGDDEGLNTFLDEPPISIDYLHQGNSTALIAASIKGHETTVALLLSRGADVNKPGANGLTALMAAALYGHPGVAQTLLASGTDVDQRDVGGATAFSLAAEGNRAEIVDLLLQSGANIETRDWFGQTALLRAARGGALETVRRLLPAARADSALSFDEYINARNQWDYTALMHAYDNWNFPIVRELMTAGAATDGYELRIAAMNNDLEQMDALLASGADINAFGESFKIGGQPTTALTAAGLMGHGEAVDFLLSKGANPAGTAVLLQLILAKESLPGRRAFGVDFDRAEANGEAVIILWSREEERLLSDPERVERVKRIIARLGSSTPAPITSPELDSIQPEALSAPQ